MTNNPIEGARRQLLAAVGVPRVLLDVERVPPPRPFRDPSRPHVDPEALLGSPAVPWCVLLTGPVGAGKSVTAAHLIWCSLIARGDELLRREPVTDSTHPDGWRYRERIEVARAPTLARWCRASELPSIAWSHRDHTAPRPWPFTVPVLVIDDLGRGVGAAGWPAVEDALLSRHDSRLITIITTNLDLAGIAVSCSEAVASRVSTGLVIPIAGRDRRLHPPKTGDMRDEPK